MKRLPRQSRSLTLNIDGHYTQVKQARRKERLQARKLGGSQVESAENVFV